MFGEVKRTLSCWGLQIAFEKIQRRDSISYLGYKMVLQRIQPPKIQTRQQQLRTLNDFQKLLGGPGSGGTCL